MRIVQHQQNVAIAVPASCFSFPNFAARTRPTHRDETDGAYLRYRRQASLDTAVTHLQIVEVNRQLTRRYVANATTLLSNADQSCRMSGTSQAAGMLRGQVFGPGGNTTPE